MPDINTLMQFLYDGNFLGFIQAIYVGAFRSADLWYGVVSMFFFVGLYIRTRSLLFVSVIWILLGSLFIVAMPILAGLSILFMIFGFAGVLFKLFTQLRG